MSFKTSERYEGVSECLKCSAARCPKEVSPQCSVCVCVCVCARACVCVCVCVCMCALYRKVLPDMKPFFLEPGGVLVNSNNRIQLFAHRVLESTFAASLCNLSSIFEKYLFL